MKAESLDNIGLRTRADKSSRGHNYLNFYERFLETLRYEPITVLEIGVWEGASLAMWAEYFPEAQIVGVDIDPARMSALSHPRVRLELANQADVADLVRIALAHGPFDLVVDDGSHQWDHQITTLRHLLPHVKPGRFYILEDIDTSYGSWVEQHKGISEISAAEYLKKICDYMIADVAVDITKEQDAFVRSYARRCEFICFHRRTSLIRLREISQAGA